MRARKNCLIAVTLVILAASSCATAPGPASSLAWMESGESVALVKDGKTVWNFRHGAELTKPMFHPLSLTDGTVLTWDAPPDHLWHHALWFSWKYLNHVNYWEENRETGKSDGLTEWSDIQVTKNPDYSADIAMNLAYHEPEKEPLLTERRQIRISSPNPDGGYHLDWTMTFTAGAEDVDINRTPIVGEEDGKAWGGYAGLSIRFAKELSDWMAVTTKGPVERDETVDFHCETGADGIDFSGTIGGREAGVALLDHPENLNAPTPWYIVMNHDKDFSFSEAAVIYYKPHVLKAGESLTLRYRVAVHEGRWDGAAVKAAHSSYVQEVQQAK